VFTSTVILTGTVVIEGVAFRWSVTDGFTQRLTISNERLGTWVEPLAGSPDTQARAMGRAMLRGEINLSDIDIVHDFDSAT
jgi:hypothetical protein